MRLCRFRHAGQVSAGFYSEACIVPVTAAAAKYADAVGDKLTIPDGDDLLVFLPPDGGAYRDTAKLAKWVADNAALLPDAARPARPRYGNSLRKTLSEARRPNRCGHQIPAPFWAAVS